MFINSREKLLAFGTYEQLLDEARLQLVKIREKNDVLEKNNILNDADFRAMMDRQRSMMEGDIAEVKQFLERLEARASSAVHRRQILRFREECMDEIGRYGDIVSNFIENTFQNSMQSLISQNTSVLNPKDIEQLNSSIQMLNQHRAKTEIRRVNSNLHSLASNDPVPNQQLNKVFMESHGLSEQYEENSVYCAPRRVNPDYVVSFGNNENGLISSSQQQLASHDQASFRGHSNYSRNHGAQRHVDHLISRVELIEEENGYFSQLVQYPEIDQAVRVRQSAIKALGEDLWRYDKSLALSARFEHDEQSASATRDSYNANTSSPNPRRLTKKDSQNLSIQDAPDELLESLVKEDEHYKFSEASSSISRRCSKNKCALLIVLGILVLAAVGLGVYFGAFK